MKKPADNPSTWLGKDSRKKKEESFQQSDLTPACMTIIRKAGPKKFSRVHVHKLQAVVMRKVLYGLTGLNMMIPAYGRLWLETLGRTDGIW